MANLTFIVGKVEATNYVRVGHNTNAHNNDAVWSFTTDKACKKVSIRMSWDNEGAGTGWAGSFTYVFALSTSGADGRTAATGTHIKKVTKTLSGASGSTTVDFNDLTLAPNTTYYIRANFNGDTFSNMKAFFKNGNTYALTPLRLLVFNGNDVTALRYNGNEVQHLVFNGNNIF